MRIGFDAKRLFNNFTGLGNYSRFIVNALGDSFPQHELFLYSPKISDHPEVKPFLRTPPYFIGTPQNKWASLFSSYWRSVSLGKRAVDDGVKIFHGLSNELPTSKPPGLKMVVTVHDLIFKRFPTYYNPIDIQIYSWKLKQACANADCIVAVSQQTASDLREFVGIKEEKLAVIYQGSHRSFGQQYSQTEVEQVRKKYDLPERFILMVGTIERRKNALTLVRALSHLQEPVPLVLVGKPTEYLKEVQRLVSTLKLDNRITFVHNATFADLPLIYRNAEIFVYPSIFEGFGIPIVEAIASGIPVITSRGSCFSEAGGPHSSYVNPSNHEELAVEIARLWKNASLRSDMVAKSKDYIRRFEPPVLARQMMDVYNQVIGN